MKISYIPSTDNRFPNELSVLTDPPKGLHHLGELTAALDGPTLAVVGTRKVSPYGRHVTEKLVREAAKQGITIISGLALGVGEDR